jgi:hypothetical protein
MPNSHICYAGHANLTAIPKPLADPVSGPPSPRDRRPSRSQPVLIRTREPRPSRSTQPGPLPISDNPSHRSCSHAGESSPRTTVVSPALSPWTRRTNPSATCQFADHPSLHPIGESAPRPDMQSCTAVMPAVAHVEGKPVTPSPSGIGVFIAMRNPIESGKAEPPAQRSRFVKCGG